MTIFHKVISLILLEIDCISIGLPAHYPTQDVGRTRKRLANHQQADNNNMMCNFNPIEG